MGATPNAKSSDALPPSPLPPQVPSGSRFIGKRLALLLGSFLFFFSLLELGYRQFDPYPYFPPWQINKNEHGNLTDYDADLGWRGTPNATVEFVTQNARVRLAHNESGHRDIPQSERHADLPAVLFLGDSFAWGYDVSYEQMFINRVRTALPQFEVYNFGHRGYGTDQALLSFEAWKSERPLEHVFLMFYENDLADNAFNIRYIKNKPQFLIREGQLVLTNVPVPPNRAVWEGAQMPSPSPPPSIRGRVRSLAFSSHLLHALHRRFASTAGAEDREVMTPADLPPDAWEVTRRLIHRIDATTTARGGTLCVVRIPSKGEMLTPSAYEEFGRTLSEITQEKDIDYLDLKEALSATRLRTYYRDGIHWTPHGHAVATEAIMDYLGQHRRSDP